MRPATLSFPGAWQVPNWIQATRLRELTGDIAYQRVQCLDIFTEVRFGGFLDSVRSMSQVDLFGKKRMSNLPRTCSVRRARIASHFPFVGTAPTRLLRVVV